VIYVDAGELTVAVDQESAAPAVILGENEERSVHPGEETTVSAGQTLVVDPDTRYTLEHESSAAELRAFEVDFPRYAYTGPLQREPRFMAANTPSSSQSGPLRETLVEVSTADLSGDAAALSFGRMTLPPGSALSLAGANGSLFLTIEEGTLGIVSELTNSASGESGESRVVVLKRGETAVVPAGNVTFLHTGDNEPVAAVAVTVLTCHGGVTICP
jgi:mannose-6-phosphate isomerase-like protein (cupin superfamily)